MKLKRIDKRVARRLAESSDEVTVYIVPVKLAPIMWNCRVAIEIDDLHDFDSVVEDFTKFYCFDTLSGRYPAFYIEDETGIEYEEVIL